MSAALYLALVTSSHVEFECDEPRALVVRHSSVRRVVRGKDDKDSLIDVSTSTSRSMPSVTGAIVGSRIARRQTSRSENKDVTGRFAASALIVCANAVIITALGGASDFSTYRRSSHGNTSAPGRP